ncbi:hypothetical protein OAO18_02755 [Francisellaceae bacterium]|nr:hypothetical protein [Francisellaceae bacterium]
MRVVFLYFVLIVCSTLSYAAPKVGMTKPQNVRIGVYIMHINDLDIKSKVANVVFWLWFIHKPDSEDSKKDHFDITNAESYNVLTKASKVQPNGEIWNAYKIDAKLSQSWDMTNYPLNSQSIKIDIENYYYSANDLIYSADNKDTGLSDKLDLTGWKLIKSGWHIATDHYNSSFGNTAARNSANYSQAIYAIDIQNNNLRTYVKLFGLLYLASFLILCMFILPIDEFRGRISLNSSAIFAIVGNVIATNASMPASNSLTLVDKVQFGLLAYMGIMLICLLGNYYVNKHYSVKVSRIINAVLGILTASIIIVANIYVLSL